MERVAQITGLDGSKIIYNPKLNPVFGVDEEKMRGVYGCADVVISTSVAEGWGLSCTEAFACGIPALFPKHTSLVEIIGKKSERGNFIEMAGNRVMDWNMGSYWFPLCDEKSGADMLGYIYNNRDKALGKAKLASSWVKEHTWDSIGSKWVEIFDHIGDTNES
jgi:glycosyltransferase involved in cell wall biosynthesis